MAPCPEWSSDFVHTVDPVAESKAIRVACIFPVDACNKDILFLKPKMAPTGRRYVPSNCHKIFKVKCREMQRNAEK